MEMEIEEVIEGERGVKMRRKERKRQERKRKKERKKRNNRGCEMDIKTEQRE